MAGYEVDPAALRSAVNKLKEQYHELEQIHREAERGIQVGELTAGDTVTGDARQKLQKAANGGPGSMADAVRGLMTVLQEKITAYESTLKQYETDDDAAAADAQRISRAS